MKSLDIFTCHVHDLDDENQGDVDWNLLIYSINHLLVAASFVLDAKRSFRHISLRLFGQYKTKNYLLGRGRTF